MAVTLPYYEFREVLSGPRRRRGAIPHAGRPARQVGRHARRHHRLRDPAARRAGLRHQADVVRRRRAPVHRTGHRPRRCRAARQRARRPAAEGDAGFHRSSRRRSRLATTSASWRRRTRRFAIASTRSCATPMRDGTLERIFRTWGVWNDDQPSLHAKLLAGRLLALHGEDGEALHHAGDPHALPQWSVGDPDGAGHLLRPRLGSPPSGAPRRSPSSLSKKRRKRPILRRYDAAIDAASASRITSSSSDLRDFEM